MSIKQVKQKEKSEVVRFRISTALRDRVRALAAQESDEDTIVRESDVYRQALLFYLRRSTTKRSRKGIQKGDGAQ